MAQNAEEYYDSNKGAYQYLKLSELINDFLVEGHDVESYLYAIPRHFIVKRAKSTIKDLHADTAKDHKAIELTLGQDFVFPLPQDYVDYIGIFLVAPNNTLLPLDINTSLNTSRTFLQDHEYNLLFDDEGNVLESDGNNLSNKPYRSFTVSGHPNNAGHFQLDTSKLTKYGEFSISQREGVVYFGSELAGKDIVMRYVSDGVEWERINESEITYHKHLQEAAKDLLYYKCIEYRKNVPYNEKARAKRQSQSSIHQAKIKMANFDLQAIKRVWRKGLKWVKD